MAKDLIITLLRGPVIRAGGPWNRCYFTFVNWFKDAAVSQKQKSSYGFLVIVT